MDYELGEATAGTLQCARPPDKPEQLPEGLPSQTFDPGIEHFAVLAELSTDTYQTERHSISNK